MTHFSVLKDLKVRGSMRFQIYPVNVKISFKVDYVQALKEGEVKVAYARIMLIGPGGVGKSSLLHGLMNLPLPHEAYSTQLADTYNLKHTGREAETFWAKQVGGYWVKVTDQDEIDELVHMVKTVSKKKQIQDLFGH